MNIGKTLAQNSRTVYCSPDALYAPQSLYSWLLLQRFDTVGAVRSHTPTEAWLSEATRPTLYDLATSKLALIAVAARLICEVVRCDHPWVLLQINQINQIKDRSFSVQHL